MADRTNTRLEAEPPEGDDRFDLAQPAGRYLALLDRISDLGPEAERLATDLDLVVGERLRDAENLVGNPRLVKILRRMESVEATIGALRDHLTTCPAAVDDDTSRPNDHDR